MKISVLYFSEYGTTKKMADYIAKGCRSVEGITASAMDISKIDKQFLEDSSCVILGTPTNYTGFACEVKTWLDKESCNYDLKGKLGGAFATASYLHGGADLAIQEVLTHLLSNGMLVYSGGGKLGEPPIHMGPVAIPETLKNIAKYSSSTAKEWL